MQQFIDTLRDYPAITLFLTIGLGFFIGRIKYKSFSLGTVTSTLLVGIGIGQLDVPVSGEIKTVFFMLFLFSIGYSVGPGFFHSLRGIGLKQASFAVVLSLTIFGVTVGIAELAGYSAGETVGLFSGSQTCSSLIGVGSEAITNMGLPAETTESELNLVPVCYAVTYVFGTLGTVIILSMLGPKMLGGLPRVKEQVGRLESEYSHDAWRDDPAYIKAQRDTQYRSYKVTSSMFSGSITVRQAESMMRRQGCRVYVDRILSSETGQVMIASENRMIHPGDTIVLSGRTNMIIHAAELVGTETTDSPLLNFPVKQAPVLLRNRDIAGHDMSHLLSQRWMRGVAVKEVTRAGVPVDAKSDFVLKSGDVITMVSDNRHFDRAAKHIGHIDRPTTHTDICFLALALFAGGLFGTLTIRIAELPISFGTGGGSLIAGLIFGWLRSRRPTYGKIPRSVVWFLNQIGLNAFIAVVGLNCAPEFVSGIKNVGWLLPVAGAIATTIPLLIGIWLGHKVFKFNPAFTLGCVAGTRTCTAALGAVQDVLGSTMPTIGYTITYAVSNILLIIWGLLSVIIIGG